MMLGKLVESEVVNGLNHKDYNIVLASTAEDKSGIDAWINDPLIGGRQPMQIKFRSNNNPDILLEAAIVDKDFFRWLKDIEALKERKPKRNFLDTYLLSKKIHVPDKGNIPLLGKDFYHTSKVYACLEPYSLATGRSPIVRMRWMPVLEHVASGLVINLLNQVEEWKRTEAKLKAERSGKQFDEETFDPGDFNPFDYFSRNTRQLPTAAQRDVIKNNLTYKSQAADVDSRKNVGTARIAQDPKHAGFIKVLVNLASDIDLNSRQILASMGADHPAHKYANGGGYAKYAADVTIAPITHNIEDSLDILEQMHIKKLRDNRGQGAIGLIRNIRKRFPLLFQEMPNGDMKRKDRNALADTYKQQVGANTMPQR